MTIVPDTKDWTWVLGRSCPACGFTAAAESPATAGPLVRGMLPRWQEALERPDAGVRPAPDTWSTLEYAAHVSDVCRIFQRRLDLMLTEDNPRFDNWDQDAAAIENRYADRNPAEEAYRLTFAGEAIAFRFESVPADAWERSGMRSNGSPFTIRTLAQYFLHDVVHHLHDVRGQ